MARWLFLGFAGSVFFVGVSWLRFASPFCSFLGVLASRGAGGGGPCMYT